MRHQRAAVRQGDGGDLQIIRTNGQTKRFQMSPDSHEMLAAASSNGRLGNGASRASMAARLAAGLALRRHPYRNSATTTEQTRMSAGLVARNRAASVAPGRRRAVIQTLE